MALVEFGLTLPEWERVHDTLFLAFLDDPNAEHIGLKQVADRVLGLPPTERDHLTDWIMGTHLVPGTRRKLKNVRGATSRNRAGKWIAYAPGDIVAPYAIGDVDRTYELFVHYVTHEGWMAEPYDRERRLLMVLMDLARQGMRVDVEGLLVEQARCEHNL